jgi:MFS family permease
MPPAALPLAGLAALAVAMGIGRFAFTPILPMMQAEGALSLAAGGWLAAANYAGYFGGALSAPLLRGDTAIRVGLAAIALLTLAMGLEQRLAAWLALRALAGVASAWVLVHVSARCFENAGVVYAGVGAGSMLAGALCLVLMQLELQSWHAWIALGTLSAALAAFLWPAFSKNGAASAVSVGNGWNAESVRLVLCYSAFGFGYIIPATFIPAIAREALGDPGLFGLAWPLFGAAAAASTLAVTPLVRRLGNRAVWIAGHFVMAAGVAALLVLPGMAGILAAALGVGATFMVVTMTGLQEARRFGRTALLAAMTAGFAAGQIAGPAFVSLLADAGAGLEQASAAACLLLVASACALIPRRAASCPNACRPSAPKP